MEKSLPCLTSLIRPCPARSSGRSTAARLIWSSTWVAIKIGLEDLPPLLGAGLRFALAGAGLLRARAARGAAAAAPTRGWRPCSALLPFAAAYGLIYWGEQYVPSGLAAVLFGVMPLTRRARVVRAGRTSRCGARLLAGIAVAIGRAVAGVRREPRARRRGGRWLAAIACALAPLASAIGNVAIKRRGGAARRRRAQRLGDARGGALLLASPRLAEDWATRPGARARSARSPTSRRSAPRSRS